MSDMKFNYLCWREVIERNLNNLFDKECPPSPEGQEIMTTKEEIFEEFSKWYQFWDSKCPHLDINFKFDFSDKNVHLLLIKKEICENRIMGILHELEKVGLHDEFIKHMSQKNV